MTSFSGRHYCYPNLTDEETEVQRGQFVQGHTARQSRAKTQTVRFQ